MVLATAHKRLPRKASLAYLARSLVAPRRHCRRLPAVASTPKLGAELTAALSCLRALAMARPTVASEATIPDFSVAMLQPSPSMIMPFSMLWAVTMSSTTAPRVPSADTATSSRYTSRLTLSGTFATSSSNFSK